MLIAILLCIIILILLIAMKGNPMCWDDEEETVTKTTTVDERPNIVGPLKRQVEDGQFYVIDPVDQQKIWLNSNDDMYEDADGKIWRLVA